MLRLGSERDELGVVDDQFGCPTATADIATTILTMAETAEKPGFAHWGTYHYVGADVVTWYGFASMIFAEAERFGRKAPRLRPITTADYPTAAPGPAYSVLNTAKLERVFGVTPRPLRDSLVATSRTTARLEGRKRREGHHTRRRLGLAALPVHHRHQQAADGRLQQAADLLSALGADAGRHPRGAGRDDAGGSGPLRPPARRRQPHRHEYSPMRRSRGPRAWPRPSSSAASSSATAVAPWSSATTSSTAPA